MEGRVSRLETFVETMRGDIGDIRQELRAAHAEQATQSDIGNLRADIADIRQELRAVRADQATRADIGSLRADIGDIRQELRAVRVEQATSFRWLVGLFVTLLLAMIGGFAAVYIQIATVLARLPK